MFPLEEMGFQNQGTLQKYESWCNKSTFKGKNCTNEWRSRISQRKRRQPLSWGRRPIILASFPTKTWKWKQLDSERNAHHWPPPPPWIHQCILQCYNTFHFSHCRIVCTSLMTTGRRRHLHQRGGRVSRVYRSAASLRLPLHPLRVRRPRSKNPAQKCLLKSTSNPGRKLSVPQCLKSMTMETIIITLTKITTISPN